jgi:hypothetical protein
VADRLDVGATHELCRVTARAPRGTPARRFCRRG